tara:strand:- start:160 stop:351 length:192 start_codon:yes stop_codon:yes gene_type:complete
MKNTDRTNTLISVSFGRCELELLDLLDERLKAEHISRSAWFKNKIREEVKLNSSKRKRARALV